MSGERVHLIGIGGVGMAGLAVLLKSRGYAVDGCDRAASARTRWLAEQGIPVAVGHDPSHVAGAVLVVVSSAVAADSPERAACAPGRVRLRGEVLADLVGESDSVAVCGSHGKTTTATFAAKLLIALGESVVWAIGGETGDFPVAGSVAGATPRPVLVVEADESDGTLALYRPSLLVVTNCDYDHPDHFPTPEAYAACFDAARARAGAVIERQEASDADLEALLAPLAPHNRENARLAVAVALRRGHGRAAVLSALPAVISALPDRRFQRLAPETGDAGATHAVYADYAHHPTEIRCAVAMARAVCRGRLRVLFQPHRYSRTRALKAAFASAFEAADEVVFCPTYAAFEAPLEGGDVADLYAACRAAGASSPRYCLACSCEQAWWHAGLSARPGDVTLVLGAGDIGALASLVRRTAAGDARAPSRTFWIGQGSNTWRTDLATADRYRKTDGPAGRAGADVLRDEPIGRAIPWMAGIPGTVGGWLRMNAGAFGHSISEAVEAVLVDGRWLPAAACGFGYRTSSLAGEIRDVRWKTLPPAAETAADCLARRRAFPPGTNGSVFKNPPGDAAGRLLEAAGCKGLRVGGARVWEEHANVIVRGPDATPSDVLALARLMRLRVLFRFGVALEPEVCGLAEGLA